MFDAIAAFDNDKADTALVTEIALNMGLDGRENLNLIFPQKVKFDGCLVSLSEFLEGAFYEYGLDNKHVIKILKDQWI